MMRLRARLPVTWLVPEHVLSVYDVVAPSNFNKSKSLGLAREQLL